MLIKNFDEIQSEYNNEDSEYIKLILSAYEESIKASDPYNACLKHLSFSNNVLSINSKKYNLTSYKNIYLLGAGKAAYKMALATDNILKDKITDGCISVPHNEEIQSRNIGNIKILEGAHPTPNNNSVKAAQTIANIASKANENDLIIFLLSGGASSLMCLPAKGISLDDKQRVNNLLLKSGADITEINSVRKELSELKGGKLAALAHPATIIQLVLSDVIGNPLDIIGSGPLIQNRTTTNDAINILKKYNLWNLLPESVIKLLDLKLNDKNRPFKKDVPITYYESINTTIIADNQNAINFSSKYLEKNKFKVFYYPDPILSEAKLVSEKLFDYIKEKINVNKDPFAVIAGGEPVITFNQATNKGSELEISGGRAQELALYIQKYLSIFKARKVFCLSAGTDGIDGPTDAAGAVISNRSNKKTELINYIDDYLQKHNSYNYFKRFDGLIKTGYTGTNVNDIFIALVI